VSRLLLSLLITSRRIACRRILQLEDLRLYLGQCMGRDIVCSSNILEVLLKIVLREILDA
jgi:hypothetical protein